MKQFKIFEIMQKQSNFSFFAKCVLLGLELWIQI